MPAFLRTSGKTGVSVEVNDIVLVGVLTCISGVLLGLAVSYIVLKIEKKPWPLSWRFAKSRHEHFSKVAAKPNFVPTAASPSANAPRSEAGSGPGAKANIAPLPRRVADFASPDFLVEIENNLTTAKASRKGHFVEFQTKMIDTENGRIESLDPDIRKVIKAAYVDMRLANTLVRLSGHTEGGARNFDNSYFGLCRSIAERLEQVVGSRAES
jgi:hypothetical protein